MTNAKNYFKDKKITVMGLGLLGRGVGDAQYIAEAGGKEVVVTDLKSEEELATSVEQLQDYPNIRFVLGEHKEEDFRDRDLILVAAGVPYDSPYLKVAKEAGVPMTQSAALFAKLAGIPIIGVTGTRGKSTVTQMIHHVLTYITGEEVILGGNIRGVSNLQLLDKVHEDALAVMELDSWQLQGWGWEEISPQIAVFTNFMEDHLNYYLKEGETKESAMQKYFEDKANIFRCQTEYDTFITTPSVFEETKQRLPQVTIAGEVILADASIIAEDLLLATPGEHNRLNAALAYQALQSVGLTAEEIESALATFPGVEGRLQYAGVINDGTVAVYNDNNSTTPQATKVALEALDTGEKNIVLIAGGTDKQLSLDSLPETIQNTCQHVLLLPGTGTDKLTPALDEHQVSYTKVSNIKEVFTKLVDLLSSGSIVLFSPGFTSFGLFKNEYDRNDTFLRELENHLL